MRIRTGLVVTSLVWALPALAQDDTANVGFDAHGFNMVPQDGDPRDPLLVERAGRFDSGEFWVSGLFEYADAPLQVQSVTPGAGGDPTLSDPVAALDNLAVLNLSAGYAVANRVRLAVAAPLIVTSTHLDATAPTDFSSPASGGGIGDVRLSAMIAAKQTDVLGGGLGLSVVPFVDLPTGRANSYLGRPGLGAGVKLAMTTEIGGLTVSADAGLAYEPKARDAADPEAALGNFEGGSAAMGGLAVGYLINDFVGVNAEAYTRPYLGGPVPVEAIDVKGTSTPAEAALSLRGRMDNGFHFALGGAKGISPGVGAANYRVFVQLGYGRIYGVKGDMDRDGIADWDDQCPKEAEVVNLYQDADGCPDAGGRLKIETYIKGRIEEYVPIEARIGSEVVAKTESTLPEAVEIEVPAGRVELRARAPGYIANQSVDVVQGLYPVKIELTPQVPAKLRVVAQDATGAPVRRAGLSVVGEGAPDIGWTLDENGIIEVDVPPGDFIVFVSSKGLGIYRQDVKLESGVAREIIAVLGAARAVVLQDRIQLNENVYFDTNSANLRSESFALLDEVANLLIATPEISKMEIQGHTSTEGADDANLQLSQARADAVRAYLIKRGIKSDRLTSVGYGETQPIHDESTDEGRALNRRVEFIITERVQK